MEIFWVSLFRLRLFIVRSFGYEPLIQNFDQSPFHHNESGSQNKSTLAVRGSIVPVVEGNSDIKSRWTANLTTQSVYPGSSCTPKPVCECMFKAERDGPVDQRLQAFLRSRGFPSWFTVTVGPSGSYRESDIIIFLQRHLELWQEGRDWRIYLCDDYVAHKTENVWNLCWSRGYIRHVHGGGCTPVGQTPDTDHNEHIRRNYGHKEASLLLDKMRSGQSVPKLTHEECMLLMWDVLKDPALHEQGAAGYKRVGQSIALYGEEDPLVCRAAGEYWNEQTTDGFTNMRGKINHELKIVEDEIIDKGLIWCEHDVRRLITPYPANRAVDRILENLGDDFYHDDIHALTNGDNETAVAGVDDVSAESSNDGDDGGGESADHVSSVVAGGDVASTGIVEFAGPRVNSAVCPADADRLHATKATIAALEGTLETLRSIGAVRGVQCIELELLKERRKVRRLVTENTAVADVFSHLRRAEDQERLMQKRLADEQNERKRAATKAIAARDAADAHLRKCEKTDS